MVLEVCPRTVVLDAGRVVADGPSRAILGDAALMEAHGLEQPLSLHGRCTGLSVNASWEGRQAESLTDWSCAGRQLCEAAG